MSSLSRCVLLAAVVGLLHSCSGSFGSSPEDASGVDGPDADDHAGDAHAEVLDVPAEPIAIENAGVVATVADGVVVVTSDRLWLHYDLEQGVFDGGLAGQPASLSRATASVRYTHAGEKREGTTARAGARSWRATPLEDPLGEGLRLEVELAPAGGDPGLTQILELRAGVGFLTAQVRARWTDAEAATLRVTRLSPLAITSATGGALFVGPDPATHRLLDNGFDMYFDYDGRVLAVGESKSVFFPPGATSNWNVGLHDPVSGRGLVAGFLSNDRGGGLISVDFDEAVGVSDGGRVGFTRFEGLVHYLEGRRPDALDGGAELSSELFYVDVAPDSTLEGLEAFARRFALRIGKVVRDDVPTGWNSWGGGSSAGGMASNIEEDYILANLELAAAEWKPYGMKYFFVDDGWQDDDGDWVGHPERFPARDGVDGMQVLADRIREKGMIPGLWIAPFRVSRESRLAAEHPEWAVDITPMGAGIVSPNDYFTLDISNPEVLDWVEQTFRRLTGDWGYRWIKMDFSYYTLFATNLHDPTVSASEAYVNALHRIREAIGPDTFLLTVSGQGLCFKDGDGARITLDNGPYWGDENSGGDPGIKVIYRTIAHRYYMNHTVWLNHPDLLFFRQQFGLVEGEARAWVSAVGLSGGVVKLGESYQFMHEHPEWRAMVTPLLPVYPASGRPLDLFEREFPEVWSLPVEREGRRWSVAGLFNWGTNRTVGAGGYEPEQVRSIGVTLAALGRDASQPHLVFDAWSHTWEWTDADRIERTLEPRRNVVLIVREAPAEPAIVFTTRHLMGSAVEVHGEAWDGAAGVLTAQIDTVPGDPETVYVAIATRSCSSAEASDAVEVTFETRDGLALATFTPTTPATTVRFACP